MSDEIEYTKSDLARMIGFAVARNKGGFNRSMIEDSLEEMLDYLHDNLTEEEIKILYEA